MVCTGSIPEMLMDAPGRVFISWDTLQFPIDAGGIQEIMDRRFESKIETYLNSALTPPSDASSPSAPLDKFPKKQLGEFRKRGVHSELKHAPQTWATL